MNEKLKNENIEYAMLTVNVTTDCGLSPICNASVSVSHNGPPGCAEKTTTSSITDENGKTKTFYMYTRKAKIGNRYVNLPRYSKCDVQISANGYVPLKVRELPIFPGITVVRTFDLIPTKN